MKSELTEKLLLKLLESEDQKTTTSRDKRPVVVFANNAIFFGYTDSEKIVSGESIVLSNSRQCYYFAAPDNPSAKGFTGLSEFGPADGSKVSGTRTTDYHVADVVCIADCTPEAEKKWGESTWL